MTNLRLTVTNENKGPILCCCLLTKNIEWVFTILFDQRVIKTVRTFHWDTFVCDGIFRWRNASVVSQLVIVEYNIFSCNVL